MVKTSRATRGRPRCKLPRLRTQPASATGHLAPPIRGPDAPLTRFHATSAPTCHPRSRSASKRRTVNRERRAAATRDHTRRGTRCGMKHATSTNRAHPARQGNPPDAAAINRAPSAIRNASPITSSLASNERAAPHTMSPTNANPAATASTLSDAHARSQ